jgi:hypothetical protein
MLSLGIFERASMNRRLSSIVGAVALVSVVSLGAGPSAFAAPTSQGGSDGVLFMTEKTDGAIYIGDIQNPTAPKATFWLDAASSVDQVSVTQTRIGWASRTSGSIEGKVLISDIDLTAGTIDEVAVPGTGGILALGASIQDETFYAIRNDKIYVIPSAGGSPVLALTDASLASVEWGLWVDGYNQKVFWCSQSNLYGTEMNGDGTLANLTTLFTGTNPNCDGLGVDPVTERLYMASYSASPRFSWANADGTGSVTEIFAPDVPSGGAPSSMFVSHDTGKIYMAREDAVYELNFDGSGVRVLYTGSHGSNGFQNLAVAYGRTIDNVGGGGDDGGGGGGGSGDGGGGQTPDNRAFTGFDPLLPAGVAVLFVLTGLVIVVRRATS